VTLVRAGGQGRPNARIGAELYTSAATVEARVSRLLTTLGLNNRARVAIR
jgi:DNA-binding NarL/FixJ family response regulator